MAPSARIATASPKSGSQFTCFSCRSGGGWQNGPDSNRGLRIWSSRCFQLHHASRRGQTRVHHREMVGAVGFEPTTSGFRLRHASTAPRPAEAVVWIGGRGRSERIEVSMCVVYQMFEGSTPALRSTLRLAGGLAEATRIASSAATPIQQGGGYRHLTPSGYPGGVVSCAANGGVWHAGPPAVNPRRAKRAVAGPRTKSGRGN